MYLKLSKENLDSSLITKIFLEKEIYNKNGALFKPWKFIDEYYNADTRLNKVDSPNKDLELLLNNQNKSKLFFEARNYGEYYQNY